MASLSPSVKAQLKLQKLIQKQTKSNKKLAIAAAKQQSSNLPVALLVTVVAGALVLVVALRAGLKRRAIRRKGR